MSTAHPGGFGPGRKARELAADKPRYERHRLIPRLHIRRIALHTSLWLTLVVLREPGLVIDHV